MRRVLDGWSAVIVVSALAAVAAAGGLLPAPSRFLVLVWFVVACPGTALVRLLPIQEPAFRLSLGIATSIALGIVVAETMAITHWWSPPVALGLLVVVALGAVGVQAVRARGAGVR